MKTIEYSDCGVAYADNKAETAARDFLLGNEDYIHVSTENFCMASRVLIREGLISHDQVQFLFRGAYVEVTRSGSLYHWPAGFCDTIDVWLERLLVSL